MSPTLGRLRLPLLLGSRAARRRLGPTVGVALGIAAGVAGLEAMRMGTAGALAESRAVYEDQAAGADLLVRPATGEEGSLAAEVVAALSADPDVQSSLPAVSCRALRLGAGEAWKGLFLPAGQGDLTLVGVDMALEGSRWRLVEGAAGTGLLVGAAWARAEALGVGDPLVLTARRAGRAPIDGLLAPEGLGARGFGRVVVGDLDRIRGWCGLPEGALSELSLFLRPGVSAEQVANRLNGQLGVVALPPSMRGADVEQRLNNLTAGTDLLGFVGLFLAAFLIWGLVASRAAEQARSFGLLRAAGASRAQAAASLLVEVGVAALPGVLLGALLGWPLARGVALAMGEAAQADLHVGAPDPAEAAFAATLGLLTALIAASWPILRAARQPVVQALRARARAAERPRPAVAVGALLLMAVALGLLVVISPATSSREFTFLRVVAALLGGTMALPAAIAILASPSGRIAARWLGPPAGLALAGLRWRPSRSGLAAGAVLGAVALIGGVAALGTGIRAEMEQWSQRALGWEVYASSVSGFDQTAIAEIAGLPEVQATGAASIRRVPLSIPGREAPAWISLVGVEPARWAAEGLMPLSSGQPDAVAALAGGQTALVTTVLAAQLGLHPGDLVEAPSPGGVVQLRISGEVVDYTENGFTLVVDRALLARAWGATRPELLALRLRPGADARAVAEGLGARPGVVAETRGELRGRVLALVDRSLGAMDRLLWLAGIVGLLAVGAAVSQGARERRGDVATLAAIGMTRRQIMAMLIVEGLATAAIGAIPGIVFGLVFGIVFTQATHTLGIPAPYVPPWGALLGGAAAAILSGGIAAALPGRALSRVGGAEALRGEIG